MLMPIGNTIQILRFHRLPGSSATGNSVRQQEPVHRELRLKRNLLVGSMLALLGSDRAALEVVG